MLPTVARQHIVAATSATLSYQGVNSDGEPTDPGVVTVTVLPSEPNGAAIVSDAATGGTGNYPRTVALTASQTATLDQIKAVWSSDGVVLATTLHDIVGAPLITFADFRRREPKRAGVSLSDFLLSRFEVDALFRRVTSRSFVPRFSSETVVANGCNAVLVHPDIRSVEWMTDDDGLDVALTEVEIGLSGVVRVGHCSGRVTIGYTHGMDAPPDDVVGAAAKAIAANLIQGASSIPSRADSFETQMGTATFIPRAGYGRAITAIDEVDEVLNAYKRAAVA